jgi:hypothetical protein
VVFLAVFFVRRLSSGEWTVPPSSEPEIDQQNKKKRGQNQPRDHNDLDPQLANGRNVVVHSLILVKKSVAIEKDVGAANQINDEEGRACDSQSGQSYGID